MFKKIILFISLALCTFFAFADDFPERSNTLVTDYTNTLSADNKQQLESKLVAFNDSTSTQIAVVIIKSVGSYDINDYGAQLLRKWGIGSKEKNNGILVLVAVSDHKMSIQTGYGAEGAVPDIITQQIIRNDLEPKFKEGDFYGGLDVATSHLMGYMKGEYKADKKVHQQKNNGSGFILIVIVIVILILVFRNRGGGGGQIIGRRGGASPFWWFLAGNMLGGSGRSSGGDWGGFSGGGGGGGFGGFGEGSGGGGGSSGSW